MSTRKFLGKIKFRNNMNILFLAPFYDIFVKESVEATAKYVDTLTVAVHHNYLSELSKYIPFSGYLDHVRRFTKDKLLYLNGKPENVDVHLVSLLYFVTDGKNNSLGDNIVNKVEKLIQEKEIKFDLIHAHFTWPQGYAAVKLGQKYNVPVVITIHENRDFFLKEYNSLNDRIYLTWKNADALIRVNQRDVPLLKEYNDNVYHIPNGFNQKKFFVIDKYKSREIMKLPKDKKIIFTFSYLREKKGFQYLIDSMNEIVKVRKDVLCFIGGSGPMRRKLESKIHNLELQEHITLIGYVPDNKIAYWLNAADIFVLPSLSESFGIVQIEAMACGKPVVATINGGSEEIIISEEYGLLCDPANSKDLAEKILIAFDDEWDKDKISTYANFFTLEKISKKTVSIYNDLLSD